MNATLQQISHFTQVDSQLGLYSVFIDKSNQHSCANIEQYDKSTLKGGGGVAPNPLLNRGNKSEPLTTIVGPWSDLWRVVGDGQFSNCF